MSNGDDGAVSKDSTRTHRLPTVSASQALQSASQAELNAIAFGLKSLDNGVSGSNDSSTPGIRRGQVAELYGPPGIGKTYLCLQASASVLNRGSSTVWLDCGSQLAPQRLHAILRKDATSDSDDASNSVDEKMARLTHYHLPTLSHLLVLLLHSPSFPPFGTELIVIDSLATLIDVAYPRSIVDNQNAKKSDAKWTTDRRGNIIAEIASALTRLAAVKNVAIIVTNYVVTRIRGAAVAALLRPAITTNEWESAMTTRIVLFRDWATSKNNAQYSERKYRSARFARVLRAAGRTVAVGKRDALIAFEVTENGVRELDNCKIKLFASEWDAATGPIPSKRKVDEADNSDNEYGWTEEDVQMTAEGLVDERFLTTGDVQAAAQTTKEAPDPPQSRESAEG